MIDFKSRNKKIVAENLSAYSRNEDAIRRLPDRNSRDFASYVTSSQVCGCPQIYKPVDHVHFELFASEELYLEHLTDVEQMWFIKRNMDPRAVEMGNWKDRNFFCFRAASHYRLFGDKLADAVVKARPKVRLEQAVDHAYSLGRWEKAHSLLTHADLVCGKYEGYSFPMEVKRTYVPDADRYGMVEVESHDQVKPYVTHSNKAPSGFLERSIKQGELYYVCGEEDVNSEYMMEFEEQRDVVNAYGVGNSRPELCSPRVLPPDEEDEEYLSTEETQSAEISVDLGELQEVPVRTSVLDYISYGVQDGRIDLSIDASPKVRKDAGLVPFYAKEETIGISYAFASPTFYESFESHRFWMIDQIKRLYPMCSVYGDNHSEGSVLVLTFKGTKRDLHVRLACGVPTVAMARYLDTTRCTPPIIMYPEVNFVRASIVCFGVVLAYVVLDYIIPNVESRAVWTRLCDCTKTEEYLCSKHGAVCKWDVFKIAVLTSKAEGALIWYRWPKATAYHTSVWKLDTEKALGFKVSGAQSYKPRIDFHWGAHLWGWPVQCLPGCPFLSYAPFITELRLKLYIDRKNSTLVYAEGDSPFMNSGLPPDLLYCLSLVCPEKSIVLQITYVLMFLERRTPMCLLCDGACHPGIWREKN